MACSELWLRLNPVSVNSGVTTLVRGRRGTTLVAFNAHDHLSPDLLTYRAHLQGRRPAISRAIHSSPSVLT